MTARRLNFSQSLDPPPAQADTSSTSGEVIGMHNNALYIASRTEEENQILKRKLEVLREDFNELRFVGLHPQGLVNSARDNMAAVLINVTEWTAIESLILSGLRDAGYTGPVLVIAKAMADAALRQLRGRSGVVFLEKPFETRDLVGIVHKMLMARAVEQRVHRRFNTDEMAEIVPYGQSHVYSSRVCNMSKGGAYLEFFRSAPIRKGDMVRLKVELKEVNRVYTVPAKVVWTGRTKDAGSNFTAGVMFMGAANMTKNVIGEF